MSQSEESIAEEVVGLEYHFLPPERVEEVDQVLRALQEDPRLEFLLCVCDVTINGRRLSPSAVPARPLLRKLLQAFDQESGEVLLYESPYNELGTRGLEEAGLRIEWWNFDLADRLHEFRELRSVRAFLEHGTGRTHGRPPEEARRLHDLLLHGLVGDAEGCAIWACSHIREPSRPSAAEAPPEGPSLWPAHDVSPWFHGVFWDDLICILNPVESTLTLLALTSQ